MDKENQNSIQQVFEIEDNSSEQKDSNVSDTQSLQIVKTIVKKKYKKRRFPEPPSYGKYIITPVYKNTFYDSTEIYFSGEIIVDFNKLNKTHDDLYSPWNQFKNISCSAIDTLNRFLITKFDDKSFTLSNQDFIIKKYQNYPNQSVQELVQCLLNLQNLVQKYKSSGQMLLPFSDNHSNIYHRFVMHDQFQQKAYTHYKSLGKNAKFFARHFGPDLARGRMQFYQQVTSESLVELLGQSLEQSQTQQHRFGLFDFFEFETIAVMQKLLMNSVLNRFRTPNTLPVEYFEETEPINLKFLTHDELSFYANASIQSYSFKQFNPELKMFSLYFAIIFKLDVSPGMEQQLRIQRQKLQEMGIKPTKYQEDITYTIQSEIFRDKFISNTQQNNIDQYSDDYQVKVCGFKSL